MPHHIIDIKMFLVVYYIFGDERPRNENERPLFIAPMGATITDFRIEQCKRDQSYVSLTIKEKIWPSLIIWEGDASRCKNLIERIKFDGLIVPISYGDNLILKNLGYNSPEEVGCPVFEAYKHLSKMSKTIPVEESMYLEEIAVHDAFTDWVSINYQK